MDAPARRKLRTDSIPGAHSRDTNLSSGNGSGHSLPNRDPNHRKRSTSIPIPEDGYEFCHGYGDSMYGVGRSRRRSLSVPKNASAGFDDHYALKGHDTTLHRPPRGTSADGSRSGLLSAAATANAARRGKRNDGKGSPLLHTHARGHDLPTGRLFEPPPRDGSGRRSSSSAVSTSMSRSPESGESSRPAARRGSTKVDRAHVQRDFDYEKDKKHALHYGHLGPSSSSALQAMVDTHGLQGMHEARMKLMKCGSIF